MKNWKTTVTGVLSLVGIVVGVGTAMLNGHPVDWASVAPGVLAAIGLIFAKDGNVTGGTVKQ